MKIMLIRSFLAAILCTGALAQEDPSFRPRDVKAEFAGAAENAEVKDPLRPFNEVMFLVNDKLYFWVLKPLGQGWRKVAPEPARRGIGNFFTNLRAPGRTLNAALQGKWEKAGTEVKRFAVNTSVGVLGFKDAATERGAAAPSPEDLGQTLARHRIGAGWYIVWPIFGPSDVRDTVGMFGDRMLDPVTYAGDSSFPIGLTETINRTSQQIGRYEQLKSDALDPYSLLRDLYLQRRARHIGQ